MVRNDIWFYNLVVSDRSHLSSSLVTLHEMDATFFLCVTVVNMENQTSNMIRRGHIRRVLASSNVGRICRTETIVRVVVVLRIE